MLSSPFFKGKRKVGNSMEYKTTSHFIIHGNTSQTGFMFLEFFEKCWENALTAVSCAARVASLVYIFF